MDFFQFLKNSTNSDIDVNKQKNKRINDQNIQNNQNDKNICNNRNKFKTNEVYLKDIECEKERYLKDQELDLYKNIKNGDMVRVIGVSGSILNSYKGYIGEVKSYKKNNDYALVFLHSISSNASIIKFPLKHLILLN